MSRKTGRKKSPRTGSGFKATIAQREAVSALAIGGVTPEHIARCILSQKTGRPISRATLYRHFSEELADGGKAGTARAIGTLFNAMNSGGRNAVTAAIFWLKTRESRLFSERRIHAVEEVEATPTIDNLSDERKLQIVNNVKKQIEFERKMDAQTAKMK